jgi:hypothetical protein
MARWTYLALGSLMVLCTLGQIALLACGPRPSTGFPEDDASISGGGSSQGSGASMGLTTSGAESVSGGAVSGGSGTGAGSSGDTSSGQASGSAGSGDAGTYMVRNCAATPCDLRLKTCCWPGDAGIDASYCIEGNTVNCGADIITYHCLSNVDCPKSGDLCCGVYDLTAMTASTACQASCGSNVQFCEGDPECGKGVKCVSQSCQGVSPLHFCGLQSQSPYNCTAL